MMSRRNDARQTMTRRLTYKRLVIWLLVAFAWTIPASAQVSEASTEEGQNQTQMVEEQQAQEPEQTNEQAEDAAETVGSQDDRAERVRSAVDDALADLEDADSKTVTEESATASAPDSEPVATRSQQLAELVEQAPAPELDGDESYLAVLNKEVADTLVLRPAKPAADAPAVSDDQSSEPIAAGEYQVQAGDSLWMIAETQLGDGNRWPAIYEANREILRDEDFLRVGEVLKLPDD